jgi:hypothetical protein
MSALDILRHLKSTGLHLYLTGDALRVEPKAALTEEARTLILEHRAELVRTLSAKVHCDACRNIRMAEVVIPGEGRRFVWGCAKGHMEHGHSTPELRNLLAPESCLAALDFVPVAILDKAKRGALS